MPISGKAKPRISFFFWSHEHTASGKRGKKRLFPDKPGWARFADGQWAERGGPTSYLTLCQEGEIGMPPKLPLPPALLLPFPYNTNAQGPFTSSFALSTFKVISRFLPPLPSSTEVRFLRTIRRAFSGWLGNQSVCEKGTSEVASRRGD